MKKFIISVICALCMGAAFAAGENVATSKAFVDTAVAQKQDKISANSGTAQVLTNTGTAGTVGTKDIYSASGEYADQKESLVDAATMNAAVQNAIEAEFKCVQYNPNDSTDCWLVDIGAPALSALPTGYTPLEYIESTGTQYIDTGVPVDDNNSFKIVVAVTSFASAVYYNHILSQYNNSLRFAANGRFDWYSKTNNFRYPCQLNKFYDISLGFNRMSVNGVDVSGNPDTDDASGTNVFVFARNDGVLFAKAKLKQLKIWNPENELVRDFVPARQDSDGEIGMYDLVSNTFFTNSGTGDFIAGPVANLYMPSGN